MPRDLTRLSGDRTNCIYAASDRAVARKPDRLEAIIVAALAFQAPEGKIADHCCPAKLFVE